MFSSQSCRCFIPKLKQQFSGNMRPIFDFLKINSSKRLMCTSNEDLAARAARINRQKLQPKTTSSSSKTSTILAITGIGGLLYIMYEINENPDGFIGKMYYGSFIDNGINSIMNSVASSLYQPSSDHLIPDWGDPLVYGQIPPGTPAPPLLVLDLDKTLIGSKYDAALGWRYAKRPGLNKFITALSQYYEVVIFNDNDNIDVREHIDKDGRCHWVASHGGELRDNRILKRLDKMNRDIGRIILIDDNEVTSQLYPRNTILVKPFTDLEDTRDAVLLDLIPLLQAFVHENPKDFRDTIDSLGTHHAEEAVVEYQMRVSRKKKEENMKRNRGLGGLIRGKSNATDDINDELDANRSSILSARDIVGSEPVNFQVINNSNEDTVSKKLSENIPKVGYQPSKEPVSKKKGGFFKWLEEKEKDKEEYELNKRQKLEEIWNKRMMEKAELEKKKEVSMN